MTNPVVVRSLRELDALIAERVMRVEVFPSMITEADWSFEVLPQYSVNIAAAWTILESMRGFNRYSQCTDLTLDSGEGWWSWHFHTHSPPYNEIFSATANTAPIAICLAALKTVGIEVQLQLSEQNKTPARSEQGRNLITWMREEKSD